VVTPTAASWNVAALPFSSGECAGSGLLICAPFAASPGPEMKNVRLSLAVLVPWHSIVSPGRRTGGLWIFTGDSDTECRGRRHVGRVNAYPIVTDGGSTILAISSSDGLYPATGHVWS